MNKAEEQRYANQFVSHYFKNNMVDLIRIHQYEIVTFGLKQADRYFEAFFKQFSLIAERPYVFEAVDYLKKGYRRCPCGSDSIYFKVSSEFVDIMAIVGNQDIENVLKIKFFHRLLKYINFTQ